MAEETNVQTAAPSAPARPKREGGRGRGRGGDQSERRGRGRGKRDERAPREFEQKILDLARVTRVTAGGKRMSFRCALVIGDKKSKVGMGVAKGGDVQIAIEKAYKQAKKHVFTVSLVNGTIPHAVWVKFGSAVVMLKPAPKGTGLKAGGAVRMVLEFAGIPNAVSKILNSNNKINIAKATLEALKQLRMVEVVKAPVTPVVEAAQPQPVIENV